MKKLMTVTLSLLIILSAMGSNVFAQDNSGEIGSDGGSQDINVTTSETVTSEVAKNETVYRVTVGWETTPATYSRKDKYTWDAEALNYVLKDDDKGTASKTAASAIITITNYSNTMVDYKITFAAEKVDESDIASEAKATSSANDASGSIDSADAYGAILQNSQTNSEKQAVYTGSISYKDTYVPDEGGNTKMGTYTVKIARHLDLGKDTLSLKVGKTYKFDANATWTSSDETVATVDNGVVTALKAGTSTITATSSVGVEDSCSITVVDPAFAVSNFSTGKAALLATTPTDLSYNGNTYSVYEGFIPQTANASYNEAQAFINELNAASGATNATKVVPTGKSVGQWTLLKDKDMAKAWVKSKDGDSNTEDYMFADYAAKYEGVYRFWTNETDGDNASIYNTCDAAYSAIAKTNDDDCNGFVVIWEDAALNKTTLSLRAGKTATLTCNIPVSSWTSSNPSYATVTDGVVTAVANGTATITAVTDAGNLTCTVTVAPLSSYQYKDDQSEGLVTILETTPLDFTYNSKTYKAYNGFICETAYANWTDAQHFVAELNADTSKEATNTTKILPTGVTDPNSGSWILLDSEAMAKAWALATDTDSNTTDYRFSDYSTKFGGVDCLWSSAESNDNYGHYWGCISGNFYYNSKSDSSSDNGFVVLWAPTE